MEKNRFFTPVSEALKSVESLMLSQGDEYHPDLKTALQLLLSSGGKRVRPAVVLLVGQMLHGPTDKLVLLGAAIELLHTATLVHDDLIDGALLRRGTATLNSQWSPGATVLTGDFIFARAAGLAAATDDIQVMGLFAQTLSTIVNGEINQLFSGRCNPSREHYERRIYAKTASLFESGARSAAIISGCDAETINAVSRYGYEIGMAFQMVDDILDFTGEQASLGKPVGSDLRQGLITLPALIYMAEHPTDPDLRALVQGECHHDGLYDRLVEAIRSSDAIQAAYAEAQRAVDQALAALAGFEPTPERDALTDLARYIVDRRL